MNQFETKKQETAILLDSNLNNIWLEQFKEKKGRPLRVLHIGNIANNAYLNAKFQRTIGIHADVICFDYYHVMSTPEWEELFLRCPDDHYSIRFSQHELGIYKRPDWFIQGPLLLCSKYIHARFAKKNIRTFFLKKLLMHYCGNSKKNKFSKIRSILHLIIKKLKLYTISNLSQEAINNLIDHFNQYFPNRKDKLTSKDILIFSSTFSIWKKIISHYDIVQCYATDPIWILLTGFRPYVAFEHRTLRTFTQDDNSYHRLTSLAYRMANHVFITNGDCIEYAKKLELQNYSAMIHPIDIAQYREQYNASPKIKIHYKADILLFCPIRHDWDVKGIDVHLRALPLIRKRTSRQIILLLVNWGQDLEKSRRLLKDQKCEENVFWLNPLCRLAMIHHMQAADVVLDQMTLPHFGATAPQALAVGTPVIMSYKPESTAWIINEPAPILPAFSPEEVSNAIEQALDQEWLFSFKKRALNWVDKYHNTTRVIEEHLRVYRKVLEETQHVNSI